MQSHEDEAGDALLVRSVTGSSARRILRSLLGDARPEIVRLATEEITAVLWIGDVAIRDAVPLGAAVITIEDDEVTLRAVVAGHDGAAAGVLARLARGAVSVCVHAGARRIVLPASVVDVDLMAFFELVAADRGVEMSEGRRVIGLSTL